MSNWDNIEKSGGSDGWEYDEVNLTYDALVDPDSGSTVYYNGIGTVTTFTNITKSS